MLCVVMYDLVLAQPGTMAHSAAKLRCQAPCKQGVHKGGDVQAAGSRTEVDLLTSNTGGGGTVPGNVSAVLINNTEQ